MICDGCGEEFAPGEHVVTYGTANGTAGAPPAPMYSHLHRGCQSAVTHKLLTNTDDGDMRWPPADSEPRR